jgi:hypothetical protein
MRTSAWRSISICTERICEGKYVRRKRYRALTYRALTSVDLCSRVLTRLRSTAFDSRENTLLLLFPGSHKRVQTFLTSCPLRHPTLNSQLPPLITAFSLSASSILTITTYPMPLRLIDLGDLYASQYSEQTRVRARIRSHYYRKRLWDRGVVSAYVRYVSYVPFSASQP